MYIAENVIPQPGKTYATNKKGSDTVVTLDGTNVVMRYWENLPSQKWDCVETDGWLGFFSRASTVSDCDAYLGHNSGDGLECRQSCHQGWESFQLCYMMKDLRWRYSRITAMLLLASLVAVVDSGCCLKVQPSGDSRSSTVHPVSLVMRRPAWLCAVHSVTFRRRASGAAHEIGASLVIR